jgi:hypothetical protein
VGGGSRSCYWPVQSSALTGSNQPKGVTRPLRLILHRRTAWIVASGAVQARETHTWDTPGAWSTGQSRARAVSPGHSALAICLGKCSVPATLSVLILPDTEEITGVVGRPPARQRHAGHPGTGLSLPGRDRVADYSKWACSRPNLDTAAERRENPTVARAPAPTFRSRSQRGHAGRCPVKSIGGVGILPPPDSSRGGDP